MLIAIPASDMMFAVSPMKYILDEREGDGDGQDSHHPARAAPPKSRRNTITTIQTTALLEDRAHQRVDAASDEVLLAGHTW